MINKNMKMVMIAYNHALDDEMFEILEQCGITGFTKINGVTGNGASEPHLGTNIWPATNNLLFIAVTAEQLKKLRSAGKKLSASFAGEGLRGFMFNLAEMW